MAGEGEHTVHVFPKFQLGGVKDGLWGGDSSYVLFTTISKAKGYSKRGWTEHRAKSGQNLRKGRIQAWKKGIPMSRD